MLLELEDSELIRQELFRVLLLSLFECSTRGARVDIWNGLRCL